jgi:glyoxylase-like metal-dependent hydrolase (beta-lactamase superfamily II)
MKKATLSFLIVTPSVYALFGTIWFAATGFAQQGGRGPGFGPPGPPPKLTKIKDNLYFVENQAAKLSDLAAYGGNLTIYLTDKGVVLVDTKFERNHDAVSNKIKSITNQPVKYVILTHNHGDHSGGAAKFEAEGAQVVISTRDRENLVKTPNQAWLPSLTYSGRATLFMGAKKIELREMRGHTAGDTVVYFPAERVICAGDLVTLPWEDIPLIINYGDGGNWTDWSHSIDELLKMDWDVMIPGHGPSISIQQLMDLHNRMVQVIDRFRMLLREGKNQQEITQTIVKEFNWGTGPAAGLIPGMMAELR